MKLALLAVCVGAFLAAPGIAAADTPQGQLTGSATILGFTFAIGTTVVDGGTSYVGLGNDLSGTCDGDSGTVSLLGSTYNVVCAHYVAASGCCNAGSPKMRFAYGPVVIVNGVFFYTTVRITDNGASTDTFGSTGIVLPLLPLEGARSWVNTGAIGSGNAGAWTFLTVTNSTFTVTR
jgi:hypothetical protein